jgi:hypothetical protein
MIRDVFEKMNQNILQHYLGAKLCNKCYYDKFNRKTITHKHKNSAYIGIRGTQTIADWMKNAHIKLNPNGIHSGFHNYMLDCYAEIDFKDILCDDAIENVFVVSHSIGACASIIMMHHMELTDTVLWTALKKRKVEIILMGCPIPGNKIFMKRMREILSLANNISVHTYENTNDVIPKYPLLYNGDLCDISDNVVIFSDINAFKKDDCFESKKGVIANMRAIFTNHSIEQYLTNLRQSVRSS